MSVDAQSNVFKKPPKTKRGFRFVRKSKILPVPSMKNEMEQITNQLIAEVTEDIQRNFKEQAKLYNPKVNPIGEIETKQLMFSLIRLAVSRRKLFNERILYSVEQGGLFRRYYGKLHRTNELSVDTALALRERDMAEYLLEEKKELLASRKKTAYKDSADLPPEQKQRSDPMDDVNRAYAGKGEGGS